MYGNCSCSPQPGWAEPGACDTGACSSVRLGVFLALFGVYALLSLATSIPIQESQLRSLPLHLRSFAFGLRWLAIRILGSPHFQSR